MVLHPFPSAFGKILAFLAQPSTNGEKYALLSAGNVSVNHQQVVIQPTSKHIKCIFDTKSFHLVLPLTKHTKKDKYKFAFLISFCIFDVRHNQTSNGFFPNHLLVLLFGREESIVDFCFSLFP